MPLSRRISGRVLAFAAKLDLGRKPMDYGCAPIGTSVPQPKVWYPNLWIEGVDQPIDLPDKGTAIIDYRVTRKTTTDTDGKKRHEASLEVHSIEPLDKGKKGKDALPGVAKAVKFYALQPGMITFERPRNTDGEFAPQTDGAPDPATMRAAYGPKPGVGTTGKVVGAAAGLGGTAAAALLLARKLKGRGLKV